MCMRIKVRVPSESGDEVRLMDSEELKKKLDTHLIIGERKVKKKQKVMDVEVNRDVAEKFAVQGLEELEAEMKKASVEYGQDDSTSLTLLPKIIGG